MKNKIISGGIVRENLRRLKIFAIIFAAIILLFEVLPPVVTFLTGIPVPGQVEVVDFDTVFAVIPFLCIFAPFFMVMILFGGYNKRPYSDFAHSLPYTRSCVFFSKLTALYATFAALILFALGVGFAAYSAVPAFFRVNITMFWESLLTYFSAGAFIVSSLTIAVSLTGTVFSNITAAGLVMFFPRFILFVITEAITSSLPFIYGNNFVPLLSPRYNTLMGIGMRALDFIFIGNADFYDFAAIIYTLIVATVYLVFGLLLFKRRKSETAEQPAPGKGVQCAIRVLIALVFTVPGTAVAVTSEPFDWSFIIVMYSIGLIAYFAYELITTKSLKNIGRAVPALLIVLAINVLCGLGIMGITNVTGSYCPTANEVEAVYVERNSYFSEEGQDPSSKVPLNDLKTKSIVCNILKENIDAWKEGTYDYYYTDKYTTRSVTVDGGIMKHCRRLFLTKEQNKELIAAISENSEYRKCYMTLTEPLEGTLECSDFSISPAVDEKELISVMQKEIDKMGFEKWYAATDTENYGIRENVAPVSETVREVNISYNSKDNNVRIFVPVNSALMPNTYDYLIKTAYKNFDTQNLDECLEILTDKEAMENADYVYIAAQIYDGDKYYCHQYDNQYYDDYETVERADGENTVSKEKLISLIADAAKTSKEPDGEHYMIVNIDFSIMREKGYDGHYVVVLPLPDSFKSYAGMES